MNKKFKVVSAVLASSLLIAPSLELVYIYDNVARAEEENKTTKIIGESRDAGVTLSILALIGYGYTEWIKPYEHEWTLLENTLSGWVKITSPSTRRNFWFYKENGNYKKGWHWDNNYNGWYYFYDVSIKIGEQTFSKLEKTITVMHDPAYDSKWLKLNEKWYEFEPGGKLIEYSGWRKYNGKWLYHLPGDYGAIANQSKYIDGEWYTFDSNGYWI